MNEDLDELKERNSCENESQDYTWANCKAAGWQSLILSNTRHCVAPEPPMCVLDCFNSPVPLEQTSPHRNHRVTGRGASASQVSLPVGRSRSPRPKGESSPVSLNLPSPAREPAALALSASTWQASLKRATSPFPTHSPRSQKDFVHVNIEGLNQPTRLTKTILLDQAASQLRESEVIGNSLAERLKQIHKKMNSCLLWSSTHTVGQVAVGLD